MTSRKFDSCVFIEERFLSHLTCNICRNFYKKKYLAVDIVWLHIAKCVGQVFWQMDKILRWLTIFKIEAFFSCSKIITKLE